MTLMYSTISKSALLLTLACALSACSGSSGDSSSNSNSTGTTQPANAAPVVNAGADQTVKSGDSVTIEASAVDTDTLTFSWRQVSGTSVTLATTNTATLEFTAPSVAATEDLVFEISVSDGVNDAVTDNVTIKVEPLPVTDNPPQVEAGADQTVTSGDDVSLTATITDDGDVTASWQQLSGPSVTLTTTGAGSVSFVAPSVTNAQDLVFEIRVDDGVNPAVTDRVTVRVNPMVVETNNPPQVNAGQDQSVTAGEQVTLNATVVDEDEVSLNWQQKSGASVTLSSTNTLTTTFTAPSVSNESQLVFEISANDGVNAAVVDSVTVTVAPVVVNNPPQVDAGADQSVSAGESVSLMANVVDDGQVTLAWTQTAGTAVTLSATDTANVTFTAPSVSTDEALVFEISADDGVNPIVKDSVTINVAAAVTATNQWIVNSDNELAKHILDSTTGIGVEVNVQSVAEQQVSGKQFTVVNSEGIPNYSVTITSEIMNDLTSRPKANTDFVSGSPSVQVGDVVEFGQDIGYASRNTCGTDAGFGYWPPGPECPTDSTRQGFFPQAPTSAASEQCTTGLGKVGLWVNGSSVYNWGDGQTYNNQGAWSNLAPIAEAYDVDICGGHAAQGDYHHHFYSSCLANMVGDKADGHSPLYGYAADGYPIYGPWEANGVLAKSAWAKRDYTAGTATGCSDGARSCALVNQYDVSQGTQSVNSGPGFNQTVTTLSGNSLVATNGFYKEDYYWDSSLTAKGGAYLDQYNGHTDAQRGYHYHVTVTEENGKLTPAFPFTVGVSFAGELESNAISSCGGGGGGGGGNPPGGGPGPGPGNG